MNQTLLEPEVQSQPQTVEASGIPDVPERPPAPVHPRFVKPQRIAFVQSSWHRDVVEECRIAFLEEIEARHIARAPCSGGMGTCLFPMPKVLADAPALVILFSRSSIPGGRCSQGGVKIPTGGKGDVAQARERLLLSREEGSADSVRFRSRRLQSG